MKYNFFRKTVGGELIVAKSWNGTTEYQALLNEIRRHPTGTSSKVIFEEMLPETRSLLDEAGRTGGKTGEWSVYRQICKMNQTIAAPTPDTVTIGKVLDQIAVLESQLQQLKINLEYLMMNAELNDQEEAE